METCKFCGREFGTIQALGSHTGKCKSNPNATNAHLTEKQIERNKNAKWVSHDHTRINKNCEYCNRHFNSLPAYTSHLKYFCKQNPNNVEVRKEFYKKCSEIQKKAVTKERRETQSKRTVFNNFWKYRAKNPIIYESKIAGKIKLDSNWELKVAKRLDDLNVEWFRPKYTLPYLDCDGAQHLYHPDFYVKTFNCFIEVKSEFVAKHQNSNNKCEYIKEHYPFVKWIETEEACENFLLEDLKCDFVPEKDEEDISYWLKMEEQKKKESKKQVKPVRKAELEQKKKEAEAKKHEAELKLLQESGIDFSKFGWVEEAKILLGWSTNKVGNYIRVNYPELNVVTRNGKNSNEGKHWYNNGIEEVSSFECPQGYQPGRLK